MRGEINKLRASISGCNLHASSSHPSHSALLLSDSVEDEDEDEIEAQRFGV